jgi:type IV secretory pathway VirB2 component (pilin)
MRKRFHLDELGVPFGRASTALDRINMSLPVAFSVWVSSAPDVALGQATSPFMTGATALQTNILAWLTPIAIILVMVLGAMAMAARMSWGWCIGAILGIVR